MKLYSLANYPVYPIFLSILYYIGYFVAYIGYFILAYIATHKQMYADMFLYIPWDNEERFLGHAKSSIEVCQAMWDEYGEAAIDLKNQLRSIIKQSWMS